MKYLYAVLVAAVVITARVTMYVRRRNKRSAEGTGSATRSSPKTRLRLPAFEAALGDVGIVASREIRERLRGRIFKVGTLLILVVVAAAIVIPAETKSSSTKTQTVGLVGPISPTTSRLIALAAKASQETVHYVHEASPTTADADLRAQRIDVALVDGDRLVLWLPAADAKSPADPAFVQTVAEYIGVVEAYRTAGLTAAQAAIVSGARAAPIQVLQQSKSRSANAASIVGIVLLFVMLNQYCTWILIGVMQEKSSRVVEVLLSTVRPIQLLGGKVLGIGLVALGQATVIVAFALGVGKAVGSDLLHGSAPIALACELLWLVLGYAFYCWVYAAAGSTAERQDQVQTLALPLSIPILIGYIFSITVVSAGSAPLLYKVLAYLPPTAPFGMPVLVGLNDVTWWEFTISVLITVLSTAGMAIFASRIYRRAVLRTGSRVHLRELFARAAR
ncbi:MAG TPA: ABC transporter permease [Acidimicrobiales bacterium]|nr:ABC transporter permease [Acidimicrobiales bacterium]